MFIVLEGLDGAGKSTQLQNVNDYLASQKIKSKFVHFPRFDTPVWGELIAKFLRGDLGEINTVDPYIVAMLFAGDRYDASSQINSWIMEGYCVLADRYVYSNIAYQCAKISDEISREALQKWILHTEYDYFKIPKPDLTLFLDVPFRHVEQKLKEVRSGNDRSYLKGKEDIHESSLILQQQVREIYRSQEKFDKHFITIDCGDDNVILPADKIFEKIKSHIQPLIHNL